jgi:hypothetical protein
MASFRIDSGIVIFAELMMMGSEAKAEMVKSRAMMNFIKTSPRIHSELLLARLKLMNKEEVEKKIFGVRTILGEL